MDRNKERSRVRIPAPRRAAASPAAKTGCPRWSRTQVALSNVNRKSFPFAEWCPVGASGETDNKLAAGRARPGGSKAWRAHRGTVSRASPGDEPQTWSPAYPGVCTSLSPMGHSPDARDTRHVLMEATPVLAGNASEGNWPNGSGAV